MSQAEWSQEKKNKKKQSKQMARMSDANRKGRYSRAKPANNNKDPFGLDELVDDDGETKN